jgi:hypothetical protein
MPSYIVTKVLPVSGLYKTLFDLYPTMFQQISNNRPLKIVFTVEAGGVLAARSLVQNTSCYAEKGEDIKLVNNSTGTSPSSYTVFGSELYGDILDLRTAIGFLCSGVVNMVIYI